MKHILITIPDDAPTEAWSLFSKLFPELKRDAVSITNKGRRVLHARTGITVSVHDELPASSTGRGGS